MQPDSARPDRSAVVDQIAAEARRLEEAGSVERSFIERARAVRSRMGVIELRPGDLHSALSLLEQYVTVDADVSTASNHAVFGVVKRLLKKTFAFYARYLGQQVTLLGEAVVQFGTTVSQRVEQLDGKLDSTQESLAELEARVRRLEDGPG